MVNIRLAMENDSFASFPGRAFGIFNKNTVAHDAAPMCGDPFAGPCDRQLSVGYMSDIGAGFCGCQP